MGKVSEGVLRVEHDVSLEEACQLDGVRLAAGVNGVVYCTEQHTQSRVSEG